MKRLNDKAHRQERRVLKKEVLCQMHNSIVSGLLGQKKTREKIMQRFYWIGVREDVNFWCNKCEVCALTKMPSKTVRAPLGKMSTGAPWDRLEFGILGPFPESNRGNNYILVITDHFSKWVEIFALPDQTAVTCAEVLLKESCVRC